MTKLRSRFSTSRATGTESSLYPSHGSGGGDIYIGFGADPVGVGVTFSCVQKWWDWDQIICMDITLGYYQPLFLAHLGKKC